MAKTLVLEMVSLIEFHVHYILFLFFISGSAPRAPCISILCYHGSQKLNKTGQPAQYKVVQYPNSGDSKVSNADKSNLYPDVILPCNELCVRCQPVATEGLVVNLNAFPASFFLSLVFIEVFVSSYLEEYFRTYKESDSCGDDGAKRGSDVIDRTIVFELTDILSSFLLKQHLPAVVKEIVFHLLAQLLRACYKAETILDKAQFPEGPNSFGLFVSRLAPLRVELQKLIEKELSVNNTAALDFILNCNFEHSKFSSYLQALLGLLSAVAETSGGMKDRHSWGKLQRILSLTDLQNAFQVSAVVSLVVS